MQLVILLTGASGFIGTRLADALCAAGHSVVCAVRRPGNDPRMRYVTADFTRDFDAATWMPRLEGVDVVINAVGIIQEQGAQTFEAIHDRAPRALFEACAAQEVRLVLQVSALGADEQAVSRYHLSKKRADDFLRSLPLHSVIIQPSLVYGRGGGSATLFTTLASLPLTGVPGGGEQQIQPIHVDDVIAAILQVLEQHHQQQQHLHDRGARLPLVGPEAMRYRDFLASLRASMGLGKARFLPVPMPLMRLAARAGSVLPGNLLDTETLDMLERGNTANPTAITALLGRAPRPVEQFIGAAERSDVRTAAQLNWLLPLLRISIALVWIVTGIVSLGLYPVADSYALLARVGITGPIAPLMLYGAAVLDIAFGIGILVLKRRYWLWLAQLAVILFYTFIISWRLPEFWLHPYGPLLKNLPMLAAIWMLFELEKR